MAWQIEKKRMADNGKPTWHPSNLMIRFIVLQAAWLGLLVALFGLWSIPICFVQYLFPRLLLAVGDYLEHYGLGRKQLPDGSYEKIRPNHAWDDSTLVSSMLFCQIDRHSDHHTNVGRPYQILRVMDEAPRLPQGYLTMIPIAFIPLALAKANAPHRRSLLRQGRGHTLCHARCLTGKVRSNGA